MRRRALAVMATTLLVAISTASAPSPVKADVPELEWCTSDAGLAIGSTGSSVACLQFTLAALGLYHATLTQKYDKPTAEAMAIFQSNNPPLRVEGVARPLALTQVGIYSGVDAAPPPLCLADARLGDGSNGASVKCLQDKLIEDGYLAPTGSTGKFDKLTAAGVRAFQIATPPLPVDGIAGPSTLAAMGIWSGKTTIQGGAAIPPAAATRTRSASGRSRSPRSPAARGSRSRAASSPTPATASSRAVTATCSPTAARTTKAGRWARPP